MVKEPFETTQSYRRFDNHDVCCILVWVLEFWNRRRRVLNCTCAEGFFKGGCTTTIAFQNDQMFQNNTTHRHMFCRVARFSQTTRHGQE